MNSIKKRKRTKNVSLVKAMAAVVLLALVISVIPSFVQADREAKLVTMPTSAASKREVVYARLKATGDVDSVYVVNHFHPTVKSSLTDYGDYREVIQLTGDAPPVLNGTTVSIAEAEGPYYYQGNLKSCELPWLFDMTWKLNGEERSPETLSGVSGELELEMSVQGNDQIDGDFFDQYALQISIPVDPERAQIIAASEGFMVAYAGTEQQMTYMALPGIKTTAKAVFNVHDFAMGQITIAGVPLAFDIDLDTFGELGDMFAPLEELESGIADFADGAATLRKGYEELLNAYNNMSDGGGKLVSGGKELTNGANQLKDGMKKYTAGVDKYIRGVSQVSNGYQGFDQGLQAMYQGTKQLDDQGVQLVNGSAQFMAGLNATVNQLPNPQALQGIAFPQFTPEQLQGFQALGEYAQSIAGTEPEIAASINQLLGLLPALDSMSGQLTPFLTSYPDLYNGLHQLQAGYAGGGVDADGQPVIGIHNGLKGYVQQGVGGLRAGFEGSSGQPGLLQGSAGIKSGLNELANSGRLISSGGSDLVKGIDKTGRGIADYVDGVSSFNKGLNQYRADGLIPYYDGLVKFENGGKTLKSETSNLPQKFEDAIRKIMEEYGDSIEIKSFVSDKNKDVTSVQFVFMTEEIPPKAK